MSNKWFIADDWKAIKIAEFKGQRYSAFSLSQTQTDNISNFLLTTWIIDSGLVARNKSYYIIIHEHIYQSTGWLKLLDYNP